MMLRAIGRLKMKETEKLETENIMVEISKYGDDSISINVFDKKTHKLLKNWDIMDCKKLDRAWVSEHQTLINLKK